MKNPRQDEEAEYGINEKDNCCGHQPAPATSDKPPRFVEQSSASHRGLSAGGTYHTRQAPGGGISPVGADLRVSVQSPTNVISDAFSSGLPMTPRSASLHAHPRGDPSVRGNYSA